jgi:hypothetical protein
MEMSGFKVCYNAMNIQADGLTGPSPSRRVAHSNLHNPRGGLPESTDPLVGALGSPVAFGRAMGGAGHCAQQLIGGLAVVEGTVSPVERQPAATQGPVGKRPSSARWPRSRPSR